MASIQVHWTEVISYVATVEVELTGDYDTDQDLITEALEAEVTSGAAVIQDFDRDIHSTTEAKG